MFLEDLEFDGVAVMVLGVVTVLKVGFGGHGHSVQGNTGSEWIPSSVVLLVLVPDVHLGDGNFQVLDDVGHKPLRECGAPGISFFLLIFGLLLNPPLVLNSL